MSDQSSSRRKFLQVLGVTAGTALISSNQINAISESETVHKLNPEQQEFMDKYGKWMDEFIDAIRIQKTDRSNTDNNLKMAALSDQAETFKPELAKFMQDEKFAMIYNASIQRTTSEI